MSSRTKRLLFALVLALGCSKLVTAVLQNLLDRYRYGHLPGPRNRPLLGTLWIFSRNTTSQNHLNFSQQLLHISREYEREPFFMFWRGLTPSFMIHHPTPMASVLFSQTHLGKRGNLDIREWIGEGLAFNDGGLKWISMRKLLSPCFHQTVIKSFKPQIHENVIIFLRKLQSFHEKPFEFHQLIGQSVLMNFLHTQMRLDREALAEIPPEIPFEYVQALNILLTNTSLKNHNPLCSIPLVRWFTKPYRDERRYRRQFEAIANRLVQVKLRQRLREDAKTVGIASNCIMDVLLEEMICGRVSLREVIDELHTFVFAGHDTSSGTLTWTVFLLCLHPQVQTKLREELHRAGLREGLETTLDQLNELEYLDAVIKETMRLYPVVPFIARKDNKPIDLDLGEGRVQHVRGGAIVFMSIMLMQRNRTIWGLDADKFDPERFLSAERDARKTLHPLCLVPFSAGPRNCIGQRYANYVVKYYLAHLIMQLDFSTEQDEASIKPHMGPIMVPFEGLWVRAKPVQLY